MYCDKASMIAVNYSLDEYIPYSSAILHFVKPNIIIKFVDRIIDLGPDGGADSYPEYHGLDMLIKVIRKYK